MSVIVGDHDRRFWAYVDRRGDQECWPWLSTLTHEGYGVFQISPRQVKAHRYAYESLVGPIPEGHDLDHVCHSADLTCMDVVCAHRRCVNPSHLEPVPPGENVRRANIARPIRSLLVPASEPDTGGA